ncbi:MAG: PD40 domain-containing protein [Sphingobacteriaceae bacterium]|nr:PD40 domain-containing protein [Sphingobacteriaceae bacterium]
MRIFLILFTLTIFSHNLFSQVKAGGTYKEYFMEGSYLMLEENYIQAKDNFQAAYEIDSTSANIHYLIGVCYLRSATQKASAERHLEMAVKSVNKGYKIDDYNEKSTPPLAHFYYGQALHINYKFEEALEQYNKFEKFVGPNDKDWKKMLEHHRMYSKNAKTAVEGPINIKITNLGDSINSIYPEYSPVLSSDERMLIYTTRRPNTTGGLKDFSGQYNEDIVVSYKDDQGNWSSPQSISENINTSGMEASINLSADGQTLIMYKDIGEGMSGNIYYSTFDGKGWTALKTFGSDVNSKYHESHACLSGDGHVLFFASDRPGGYGGSDIYRCLKLPNGQWSKAFNMGPTINTEYDEDGAFIHPDGHTFFFASKGHKSMGGYDIMFATLNEEDRFDYVTNMGYPINTTDDDVFYVTSPDGKRGYLSSAHEGGFGEKDLYMITIEGTKEKPLALFKGQIIPAEGEKLPEDLIIQVTNKNTGEIVGTYRPKVVNGVFSTILPPGVEYNFSYQSGDGEEFYNEDVFVSEELTYQEIKREVNLEPVKLMGKVKAKHSTIKLNAVVFDNAKTKNPMVGALLSLEEVGGETKTFNVNEKGKFDGIELEPDKKYNLYAEVDGKKSLTGNIDTKGIKSGKVIQQLVYMTGKPEASQPASSEITLDIVVKNVKTKKTIANALVIITGKNGEKQELNTNENGQISNVSLEAENKYTLMASIEGAHAEPLTVNTKGIKGSKKITKTILITQDVVATTNDGPSGTASTNTSASRYEFYFKYNRNMNEEDESWTAFIDRIVELSQKRVVKINIRSSASRVPTRAFKNNKQLASSRAMNLQKKIIETVKEKGGKTNRLQFVRDPRVAGPKYRGDHDQREKYEKHQYVKARAK